jgi:hypothetical protein
MSDLERIQQATPEVLEGLVQSHVLRCLLAWQLVSGQSWQDIHKAFQGIESYG